MNNLERALSAAGIIPGQLATGRLDIPSSAGVELPDPPCDCKRCLQQWRKYTDGSTVEEVYENIFDDEEASSILREYLADIKQNIQWLRKALQEHGDKIMARWFKAMPQGRAVYLRQAAPNISPRPLPEKWVITPARGWHEIRVRHLETFLLPFYNVEELADHTASFLSLLHHRTYYSHQCFITSDLQWHRIAYTMGLLPLDYNGRCVDLTAGPDFGSLKPFDGPLAHTWMLVGFPRAKLTLQAQALLYQRMRDTVSLIVKDKGKAQGRAGQWQAFINASCCIDTSKGSQSWYLTRPFGRPPFADPSHFYEVAKTQRQACDDHLWLLQTDPAYMQAEIRVRKMSHVFGLSTEKENTTALTWEIVSSSMRTARYWYAIENECADLCQVFNSRRGVPRLATVEIYEAMVDALELKLFRCWSFLRKEVRALVTTAPGFEGNYTYERDSDGEIMSTLKKHCRSKVCSCQHLRNDWLHRLILALDVDVFAEDHIDHAVIFSCLETHLDKADHRERTRIDQRLWNHLSNMAAIDELYSTIRLQRPSPWSKKSCLHCVNESARRRLLWRQLAGETDMTEFGPEDSEKIGKMMLDMSILSLPAGRETKSNLEKSVKARRALFDFWTSTYDIFIKIQGGLKLNILERLEESAPFHFAFSSEHEAQLGEDEKRLDNLNAQPRPHKTVPTPARGDVPLQSIWGDDNVSRLREELKNIAIKDKLKKRSNQTTQSDQIERHHSITADPKPKLAQQSSIRVNSRVLPLFYRMFPKPNAGEQPSNKTRWADFVTSMAEAGFATTGGSGSSVTFNNPRRGEKIAIHRPHPIAELSDLRLRWIGKRMNRWFGWTRECFAEAARGG